jgi:hypothetical protein
MGSTVHLLLNGNIPKLKTATVESVFIVHALRSERRRIAMPTASSITWSHDFDSALTQARANTRGILLDFTAAPM